MKRALPLLVVLVVPASAHAETASVSMPGKLFSPSKLTVVAGDSVVFRNADLVAHDVKGSGFESGTIARFATFTQRFESVGAQPFVCSLHPFMAGQVDVVAATLRVTGDVLSGRVPPGTPAVTIERDGIAAGSVTPAADGAFTAKVGDTGSYRVTTAAGASAAVSVTGAVTVKLSVKGHRLRVESAPGLVATFQVYSRERFSWRAFATAKLDARGRASVKHKGALKGSVRVVVSGRGVSAASEAVRLKDGTAAGSVPGGHGPRHHRA
jgi:plastocyanin